MDDSSKPDHGKPSTYSIYQEDQEFLNSIKGPDEKAPDVMSRVVNSFRRRMGQTNGQRAAEAAVALIEAQSARLCELVENTARVAADELKVATDSYKADAEELKGLLDAEKIARADEVADLKARLADAEAEAARLTAAAERDALAAKLSDAESAAKKAVSDADSARAERDSAKAKTSDAQEELTKEVKARAAAERSADALSAELAEAKREAELAAADARRQIETLEVKLESAHAAAEQSKGTVSYLTERVEEARKQPDDLRRQLDEARREGERLRFELDRAKGEVAA